MLKDAQKPAVSPKHDPDKDDELNNFEKLKIRTSKEDDDFTIVNKQTQ